MIIGAILELFWIDRIPIGIYIPPNDSIAAVDGGINGHIDRSSTGRHVTTELMALSILLAIPFGILAKKMDVKIIESNNVLSDQALEDAKALNIRAIERKTYLGLAKVSIFYIVLLFILQLIFIPVDDLDLSENASSGQCHAFPDLLFSAAPGDCRGAQYH